MTPTDAARLILELTKQATPAPWKYHPATEDGLVKVQIGDDHDVAWDLEGTCSECFVNMEFIAFARNHGPDIARALLAADEREREYRSAIINVIEGCHISTAGINILQSALDQDEATGKAGV